MKAIFLLLVGLLLAISLAWVITHSRISAETAPYTLVLSDNELELRDYPALTLATTAMEDNRDSESFGRLFAFITGENAKEEKIPMTTPVLIDPSPGKKTMSFVLPQAVVKKGVPQPGSAEVRLSKMEPGRYVVLRFVGRGDKKNQKAAIEELQTWLRDHKIAAKGEPVFAFYDPPWTPVFLRRNEVMVRVPKETR